MNHLRRQHETKHARQLDVADQTIVVIHGLAANRFDMWPLSNRLRRLGYRNVINWGYWSTRRSITDHAKKLNQVFEKLEQDTSVQRFHVVAHSMGCILLRSSLLNAAPSNLHRAVMLSPPNGGSHVARKLVPWTSWFCRPMAELSDEPNSFVNRLPRIMPIEFGVVAASRDRVIVPENTHMDNQSDHITVNSGHGVLPWRQCAVDQSHHFLQYGRFDHDRD